MSKTGIDKALVILAAVATPAIALAIDAHAITAAIGADIGAIVAAVVAAYHGGATVQARESSRRK